MTQKQVECPACRKWFAGSSGLRAHFRRALSGMDEIWDSSKPHTRWARSKEIEVAEGGYIFDYDKLNDALDEYLSSQ